MLKVPVIVFLVFLAIFFMGTAQAAAEKHRPAILRVDTSRIQVRNFDKAAIKKFQSDKDFDYRYNGVGLRRSIWVRFWAWLWETIVHGISRVPYGGYIVEYLLLLIAVGFLVYFILKSLGIDAGKLLRGESQKIDLPYSESLENIHQINFDPEIENAIAQHNYRLAVRLLYLRCLKQLSDAKLINWQIDKTNAAYLFELTDSGQRKKFGMLTRGFEYIWYGDFPIDQQAFGNIYNSFVDFKNQMP